ncbi:MAG: hypothetical protein WC781_04780 [Candidatus Pacearchaeota archaeon]
MGSRDLKKVEIPESFETIENLVKSGETILFETSAVLNSYIMDEKAMELPKKIDKANNDTYFYESLKNYINEDCEIYFTRSTIEQLTDAAQAGNDYRKKKIRNLKTHDGVGRQLLDLHRARKKRNVTLKRLIDFAEDKDRIINLDKSSCLYRGLTLEYSKLKEKYKLSDANWDFIASGAISSKDKKINLVSNDSGIFSIWHILLRGDNGFNKENLNMYRRIDYTYIQKLDH